MTKVTDHDLYDQYKKESSSWWLALEEFNSKSSPFSWIESMKKYGLFFLGRLDPLGLGRAKATIFNQLFCSWRKISRFSFIESNFQESIKLDLLKMQEALSKLVKDGVSCDLIKQVYLGIIHESRSFHSFTSPSKERLFSNMIKWMSSNQRLLIGLDLELFFYRSCHALIYFFPEQLRDQTSEDQRREINLFLKRLSESISELISLLEKEIHYSKIKKYAYLLLRKRVDSGSLRSLRKKLSHELIQVQQDLIFLYHSHLSLKDLYKKLEERLIDLTYLGSVENKIQWLVDTLSYLIDEASGAGES